MNTSELIKEEAERLKGFSTSLRRYFHENPELAKEEFNTASRIEEELDKLGLTHERVATTGVYSEIHGALGEGKTIVLRADIDALPVKEEHECAYKSKIDGKMHACGHDVHTAALLTATKILAEHKDLFAGTVRLAFQPGEEIGYGARYFISGGYLDGADRCYGSHVASNLEVGKIAVTPGPNNASVDWFKIHVKGKSAHVSTPEDGIDALYVASQIVVTAQALVTRRTNPIDSVLIGIGKLEAGTAYNVVAQSATFEGTIRTMTVEARAKAKKELENLAYYTALSFGASVDLEWIDFSSPLVNDFNVAREVQVSCKKLIGEENTITNRKYSLGGDDFAEFILKVPGVYAYIGSGNNDIPETTVAHHNSHFDVDERCITLASELYAQYALDFLRGEK